MELMEIAFYVLALIVVIALILLLAIAARRFMGGGGGRRASAGSPLRRRERRLNMVEAAAISPRHKLILVRRDNVEHLLLIGGATELVVESRIASSDNSEVETRTNEPAFGTPSGPTFGRPTPPPELPRSGGFPPPRYGARDDASDYDDRDTDRAASSDDDDDGVGFREPASAFARRSADDDEPDYFASARAPEPADPTSSYLEDVAENRDEPPPPNYERYRSAFERDEPEPAPERLSESDNRPDGPDDDEPNPQSRILNRFLRKDSNE